MKKPLLGLLIGIGVGLGVLAITGRAMMPVNFFVMGGFVGLVFLLVSFSWSGRAYPRHTRIAFSMFGLVTLGWSVLGLGLHFEANHFQPETVRLLKFIERLLGGMGFGLLLLLLVSGQLSQERNKQQELKERNSRRT